ncbi:MAG: hypothetical protein AB7O78_02640 [Thermoleophilia bacterium]
MIPVSQTLDFDGLTGWLCDGGSRADISPGDRLLWWLSEKETGSWADFRKAYEWVTANQGDAVKAWIMARDLQALGHVEFAWEHGLSWSVAPPVLTLLPSSGGLSYLTGARTRALIQALNDMTALDFYPEAVKQGDMGPHGIFLLFGSAQDPEVLAQRLGIQYTYSVAEVLAGVLPQLADMMATEPSPFRIGFDKERFDPGTLFWAEAPEPEEKLVPGLYRMRTYGGTEYRFLSATRHVMSCQPEPAAYESLRYAGRKILRYEPGAKTLIVPAAVRLPSLHARAATLSSGLLPEPVLVNGRTELRYENVSPGVAGAILTTLSQAV